MTPIGPVMTLRRQMMITQTPPTTSAGAVMKQLIRLLNHLLGVQRPPHGRLRGPFNAPSRYLGYPGRHL
jgi:hypothetical protein